MMRKVTLVLAALTLLACQKKEDTAASSKTETAETPKVEATAPAAAAAPTAAPEIDLETLPTEEDFEDEAEKEITSQNLEKKLDELEKEIAAE
jgi:hypothetical protein